MDSTLNPIIISKLEAICQAIDIISRRSNAYTDVNVMISDVIGSMVFDSIVLRLQTIGENIKSIDDRTKGELLSMYPEIPWHHYIGLRNILAHQYENVDPEIVWSVVTCHLDALKETVMQIKCDLS